MTSNYQPPFSISPRSINLIADISAQIERYAIRMEQEDGLMLRKINRIKTIQGSLAIEGNTLSESMITEILEGKHVVAPLREIQEVKNAIKTYDAFTTLNPYKVEDLLKAHGLMMEALIDDPGRFRRGGVGVFAGTRAVHIAPPAERVPFLMNDLFGWLKNSQDHLLIIYTRLLMVMDVWVACGNRLYCANCIQYSSICQSKISFFRTSNNTMMP